jgi:LacI family transcriptional regulator, galactose operon repressor
MLIESRVTIRDVAREAGVSVTTASRALNNKGELSEATRAVVLATAERLRFVPSDIARALVSGRTQTLGVLITDNASRVYAEALRGIEDVANEQDYGILFMNSGDVQDRALRCIQTLRSRQVDGILFTPVQEGDVDVDELRRSSLPIVAVVRRPPGEDIDFVVADNERGGYAATHHLLELGHRRIAHLGGRIGASTTEARLEGYNRALRERSLPVDSRLIRRTLHTIEDGYEAAVELLERPDRPTAIIVATPPQTIGLLRAVRSLDLRVPDDISLVMGDDADFAEILEVPLTAVEHSSREIGRQGTQLLLGRLSGRRSQPTGIVLEPRLIVRRSTAGPR